MLNAVHLARFSCCKNLTWEPVVYYYAIDYIYCSWGTDWGMDGYMKLLRGNNTCGISEFVTSAILE